MNDPTQTILVIDDNPVVLAAMEGALEIAGYGVLTAASGEEGIRIARSDRPAAAIVDFELPGIDGMTVIHRFATDPALDHVPCILLTGAEQAPPELEGLEAGADAYIRKGTETDVILARLKALLRERWRPPEKGTPATGGVQHAVLAVSSNPEGLAELAVALEGEGYRVEHATPDEGPAALCPDGNVDCIVLDHREHSLETIRALKGSHAGDDVPLVVLVDESETEQFVAAIEAGADDCISISSGFAVVLGRVQAQLRRKRVEDASKQRYEQRLEAEQARAQRELAETRAKLLEELEQKNLELEQKNEQLADTLKELRTRDRQFRTVARCVPGVVYLCENDAQRSMLFMSVMIERLLGYRGADFTEGRVSWAKLVHQEDHTRVVARIESAIAQKNHFVVEYRLRGSDALYRWVEERGRAVFDDDDEVRCIGGTIFDITERKEAEEELERFRTRSWRRKKDGDPADSS